ncbi:hypothetical protein [Granulicella sp. L60]|uniref:hypothetical protein n=1 Tax=Granulicella sp. L60 TaxID=1641866 RepID=UPI00131BF847|nr:hypothetical protein [Granulicella sp. L60]
MRRDRIRIAMDAGKSWAEQQMKSGIEITPSTAEEAAREKFDHVGSRHLFLCSALDAALLSGAVAADANQPSSL